MRYALLLLALAVAASARPGEFDDLIEELVHKQDYVRELARRALVKRGKRAVPALIEALQSKNPKLREQAAKVLGAIGREAAEALPALRKATKDTDSKVGNAAAAAQRAIEGETEKPLFPLAQLAAGNDRAALLAALKKPDLLGPAATAVPLLLRIVETKDDITKAYAGKAIGHYGEQARFAVDKLLEIGKTAKQPQLFAVIDALTGIGAVSTRKLFDLYHQNEKARPWLDEILFGLGPVSTAIALPALKSENKTMRETGCLVLGAAGPGAQFALQNLVQLLSDPSGKVRRAAANALGAMGTRGIDAIAPLLLLADDPDRRAQLEAIRALGSILRAGGERYHSRSNATKTEQRAIKRAKSWLQKQQSESGLWENQAKPEYATGVTALALIALMEGGLNREHEAAAERGLRRLVILQDNEGVYGPRRSQHCFYNHATATVAMCIAAGQLQNPIYRTSAQAALDYIAKVRGEEAGGWRYQPNAKDSDTSMTGWMLHALHAGGLAGLTIDQNAFPGARSYLEKATNAKTGAIGYIIGMGGAARPKALLKKFPEAMTRSMTAAGGLGWFHARSKPNLATVQQCLSTPAKWADDGSIDMYYWVHGTRLFHYFGGALWTKWITPLRKIALRHQNKDGSWPPAGPWGADGGPVYATALMTICLNAIDGRMWPMRFPKPKSNRLRPVTMALRRAREHPDKHIAAAARQAMLPFE